LIKVRTLYGTAYGLMVERCLEAAEALCRDFGEVEVIDLRTVAPLDTDTVVDYVKKTHRLVIVHQACRTGGLAGEIAMRIVERVFDYLDALIQRVARVDAPIPFNQQLEAQAVPSNAGRRSSSEGMPVSS